MASESVSAVQSSAMDISTLEQEYNLAQQTTSFSMHQAFLKKLLAVQCPEALAYHYQLLLRQENQDLYLRIRAGFEHRGKEAESFLLAQLKTEQNSELLADILLLIGLMRSVQARRVALGFLSHENPKIRHFALVVLGWVGNKEDVCLLGSVLIEDQDARVRGTASSALCQLWYRIPETKAPILGYLKQALEKETDEEAQKEMVTVAQEILHKKFGLREDLDEGKVYGDVAKAVAKARSSLARRKG